MTDLKEIVQEFQKIKKECKLAKLDDNTLFDCACRRFNSIGMNAPKKTFKDFNAPATERQVAFLKSLGVEEMPAGLTKIDADTLIKEKQKEQAEADSGEGTGAQ